MEIKQHATERPTGQRRNKKNFNYLVTNENGNPIYQNLWDREKAVLGEKFIVLYAHIKKQKKNLK